MRPGKVMGIAGRETVHIIGIPRMEDKGRVGRVVDVAIVMARWR